MQNAIVEREAEVKLYSPMAVHIADVMDLLPLLNRMAQLEVEHAEPVDIERVRRKVVTRLQ